MLRLPYTERDVHALAALDFMRLVANAPPAQEFMLMVAIVPPAVDV